MKAYPLAAAALLVLLFAVNLYRAVTQPWPVLFQAQPLRRRTTSGPCSA